MGFDGDDEKEEEEVDFKLVYKHDCQLIMLTNDEDVSGFMEFASNSTKPPTLFVYVDYSMCSDGDGGGSSNPTTQEGDGNQSQMQQSNINLSCSHDHTYGLNDSFPDFVPETQPHEGEGQDDDDDDDINIREGVNDYFDVPIFLPTPELPIPTNQVLPYNRSQMVFEHRTHKSTKDRYEVLCVNDGCQRGFTARAVGDKGMFHVRKFHDVHTCSRTQLNSKNRLANKKVLGYLMKSKFLKSDRTYRPQDIVDDFGLNIGYATGWRARWNALSLIRGSHSESFTRLPTYLYNLEPTNPGTRTTIKAYPSGRFEECFVTVGVAVHRYTLAKLTACSYHRRCSLEGPLFGNYVLGCCHGRNNNIVPIAFGVGRSETADEWTWFLRMLKQCIGEPKGLVFMSDRPASINAAITAIFQSAHHALCCRHLVMNVRSRDQQIKIFKTPYWKACKAYTTHVIDHMMNVLRLAVPAGAQLMEEMVKGPFSMNSVQYHVVPINKKCGEMDGNLDEHKASIIING
ncbi:hypothetical protein OSB04_016530, partial [Centaurea solstitialis]